jgi:predicted NBD/HSP70 family sugar kinase
MVVAPRSKQQAPNRLEGDKRPVGRPRVVDTAQGSLATLLNLVRTDVATTRQDLERHSELGRASVTDRIATLTILGLLREGELGTAVGGRAPRHMEFCADAAIIPVSIIEPSSLAVGLADLAGNLVAEHHEAIDLAAAGPRATLERLATLFKWMIEENTRPAWGIGVALPGAIERTEPFAVPTVRPIQSWGEFPFAEELTTRFGVPVFVRGGTQAMTMGEFRLGTAAGQADMLFVNLGRTVSAGVISEGRLHRGAQGAAGLIGSTILEGQTLDSGAGAEAISDEALRAAQSGESRYLSDVLIRNGEVGAVDVGHGAELNDEFSRALLSRVGRLVGEALAPLTNLLNPSLIVLSGSVAQTGDTLLAAVREAVYRKSHPLVTRDLRIMRSQLGGSAGLVGAAQVVVEELFAPQLLREWVALGSPLKSTRMLEALASASTRLSAEPARAAPPVAKSSRQTGKRGGSV